MLHINASTKHVAYHLVDPCDVIIEKLDSQFIIIMATFMVTVNNYGLRSE